MKRITILSTRLIQPSLIEQAGSVGIDITQKEFIRTESLITAEKAAWVQQIPADANIVFTSTNAVETLSQMVHEYSISLPSSCRIFSVDGRTSVAINALFPSFSITATSESARGLAEEILKHQINQVYYACGNLRRDELPEMLQRHGIAVQELELYKTLQTPVNIQQDFDGLIFFSPSAVTSFFSVNNIAGGATCFAIGETTANAIRECTDNDIVTAAKPRQDNIISTIIKYYQSR